jgi:ABC-2 type transport system ATP-binding protein
METHYSLSAQNISKVFTTGRKSFSAVTDLSFNLVPGESVAFLGPNGAGKSTTIKILCGILSPTSGEARIDGHVAGTLDANKQLGLVFGTRSQLFMHMTVEQCLSLIGEIYFLSGRAKASRIAELSELFEIGDLLSQRVRTLSLGQRMRFELVAALLHRPKILLADEPTIGLDVIAKNRLRELVLRWQREEKSTLLLTSHDLSDVEALCDRCILIDHGEKRFDGPLQDLKGDLTDLRRVQITVSENSTSVFANDKEIHIAVCDEFTHSYELRTRRRPMSEALAKLSAHYGDRLQDIQISEVSLEEVLAKRYAENRTEQREVQIGVEK